MKNKIPYNEIAESAYLSYTVAMENTKEYKSWNELSEREKNAWRQAVFAAHIHIRQEKEMVENLD